ncbi:FtsK/SpoIIIE domain-containing protein [Gordonia phosphorivorans]|uniref:FtsK/SpoIIIE domain-containing protein n=1 Tax=Gordonia phosphorivorans TaxID=1056982 RepID=A0ABV6H520_9ACTN
MVVASKCEHSLFSPEWGIAQHPSRWLLLQRFCRFLRRSPAMSWQQPPSRGIRRVYSEGPAGPPFPGQQPRAAQQYSSVEGTHSSPTSGAFAPATSADQREADRLEAQVRAQAADLSRQMAGIVASLASLRSEVRADSVERAAQVRRDRSAIEGSAFADIESQMRAESQRARRQVEAAAEALAPGIAGAPWHSESASFEMGAGPARYLRIGDLGDGLAALAPFLLSTNWLLDGDRQAVTGLVQSALVRTAAQVPLSHLTVHVFDPTISGVTSVLAPLRKAKAASLPSPMHSADQLREVLVGLIALAGRNAELIGAQHLPDLGALWQTEGIPTGEFALLVVLDYPNGIDEATQNMLIRLAETGPSRGVTLLVTGDPAVRAERGVKPKHLRERLLGITCEDGVWEVPGLSAMTIADEGPPQPAVLAEVLGAVTRAASESSGPTIELRELIGQFAADPWRETADDEIEAIIGRAGREPLSIAFRSENPPHPNMLVGGAVGQGKSNLLLDIIYSLAARYAPDELEMLLLDFKQGLEFKRFDADADGRNWLPHTRILCLESDKAFGLSVLQYVADEMVRRADLFNRARANGFTAYRAMTGDKMRRLLLIVDEFQVLFDGHDDLTVEAVRLFETIAKQGRAYGIHLLLSSQTVSGISGLNVKGDSIFAQFPIRVSLKNTREESEAILSRHNTAAADLTYRGEVIVNRNLGMAGDGANERGIAAFAEPAYLVDLQSQLWTRAVDRGIAAPPWVFMGRSSAQWPNPVAVGEEGQWAWLGRPVAVTDAPVAVDLAGDGDTSIALVGTGDDTAAAVLGGVVFTATARWQPGDRVLIVEGAPANPDLEAVFGVVLPECERRGIRVDRVGAEEALAAVLQLREESVTTLVLAHGLHRLDLSQVLETDPESYTTLTGADLMGQLATGVLNPAASLVAWWPQLRAADDALGFDHAGVGTYVLLRVGMDDLRSVAGAHALPFEGSPRIGVFGRHDEFGLREVIPFASIDGATIANSMGRAR